MVTTPLTVLLDIDGTIVGDVVNQLMIYEFIELCKKTDIKPPRYDMKQSLLDGLVRPYFKRFMDECAAVGAEVFIYTAAEKQWANVLIGAIERTYKIKFNRPMFTRDHCKGTQRGKSVDYVMPRILRVYRKRLDSAITEKDVRSRLLIVDNSYVFDANSTKNHLVKCETYKRIVPENIPVLFKGDNEAFAQAASALFQVMRSGIPVTGDFLEFQKHFYKRYVRELEALDDGKGAKDPMFKILASKIPRLNNVTPRAVEYLNKKVNPYNKD